MCTMANFFEKIRLPKRQSVACFLCFDFQWCAVLTFYSENIFKATCRFAVSLFNAMKIQACRLDIAVSQTILNNL